MQEFGYKYQIINDDFFILRIKDVRRVNGRILTHTKCQVIGILFLNDALCVWVCMWAAIRKTSTKVLALFSEEKDMNDAEFPLVDKICEIYMLLQTHTHTHT